MWGSVVRRHRSALSIPLPSLLRFPQERQPPLVDRGLEGLGVDIEIGIGVGIALGYELVHIIAARGVVLGVGRADVLGSDSGPDVRRVVQRLGHVGQRAPDQDSYGSPDG